jgi:hypothetical protein
MAGRVTSVRRLGWIRWIAAIVLALTACQSAAFAAVASNPPAFLAEARAYDLRRDEALGGHTLGRHVGRSDAELAERLRRERDITAASTYTDAATAARVVGLAIDASRARIDAWTARRGPRPNLTLYYTARNGGPIGRTLARGDRASRPVYRALVVLRWLERQRQWIVLTSYPVTDR